MDRSQFLRSGRFWWSLLRSALVLLWVLWAALSWWMTPRESTVMQARADLAAGRMVSHQWADAWNDENAWHWADPTNLESSGEPGPLFVWWTPDRRVHYAVVEEGLGSSGGGGAPADDTVDGQTYSGPEAASLARAIRDAGPGTRWGGFYQPPATGAGGLLDLLALAVLVLGPAPATGTRWYWFWLGAIVPFGLGLLFWLARERPWSATAQTPPDPAGTDRRRRWYAGIVLGIATGIVGSLLVYWLNRLLGDWFVPHRLG